jgi:hypothetical protein
MMSNMGTFLILGVGVGIGHYAIQRALGHGRPQQESSSNKMYLFYNLVKEITR